MATIGKDGKDDSAMLASVGGRSVASSLRTLAAGASSSRYYRVNFSLQNSAENGVLEEHKEYCDKFTLIGYIDSYGGFGRTDQFVVYNASSGSEAEALARVSPLVVSASAGIEVLTLNPDVEIWTPDR